ncbi:hypothetical protein C8R43DRAFT_607901 [Mycena crocata]|nr:hypothetical protein C8R43DRAFT_607901 [Mycena crocata]
MPRKRQTGPAQSRTVPTDASVQPAQPRPRRRRIFHYVSAMVAVGQRPTFKRLARRGGVKRIGGRIYEESRGCLSIYLRSLVGQTILYTMHNDRTTVTAGDVAHALQHAGTQIYGFAV